MLPVNPTLNETETTVDIIRLIVLTQLNNTFPNIEWDERIGIYNQPYVLPPTDGMWVEVAFVASKIYGSNDYVQFVNGVFQEVQDLYTQEHIMVRCFSKNLDTLRYKEIVAMGLNSIFARQQQEKYSFKICNVQPFPDTSDLEGGEINYRADISVMCLTAYENIISAGYLNGFTTQVTAANGSATMQKTFLPTALPT